MLVAKSPHCVFAVINPDVKKNYFSFTKVILSKINAVKFNFEIVTDLW